MKKRMAMLLSAAIALSAFLPLTVIAEDTMPTLTVTPVTGAPGEIVELPITIENNPGILGAALTFTYDAGLTLVDAVSGDAFSSLSMTKPGRYTSPCVFSWDGQEIASSDIKDGTVLTLYFNISEQAEAGTEYRVRASYNKNGIIDGDLQVVDLALIDGSVKVVDYIPGDVSGDELITVMDVVMLRRHIVGGYDQIINEAAGDVNADGDHTIADVVLIRRFIADGCKRDPDGYNVELLPSPLGRTKPKCDHVMTAVEAKAATCTEDGNIAYWRCEKCDKYFTDAEGKNEIGKDYITVKATGHTIVIDEAVAPTYESEGLTEGSHCSVCGIIFVTQEVIPVLKGYSITYHIAGNDPYLMSIGIENRNPPEYKKEDGLVLKDITVPGYHFLGWFTKSSGGTQVTEIKPGETGDRELYAQWKKEPYTIQFECDMVPIETITYEAGQEVALPKPSLDKYTFVGWSDGKGNMYDTIPAGTGKNLILYANWVSDRNKAVAKSKLDDPIICEDSDNGLILFTYEIGTVYNVPLYELQRLLCANGIITVYDKTTTKEIDESEANKVASRISNATTTSASWTLSNEWNKATEVSQSYLDQTGKTREEAETLAKSESNTYNLSKSFGGSSSTVNTSGGTFKYSENNSTRNDWESKTGESVDVTVYGKLGSELHAGVSVPILEGVADASVGGSLSWEVGANANYKGYINNTNAGTTTNSNSLDFSKNYSNTSTATKNWNTDTSYGKSTNTSQSSTVTDTISKLISEQYGYGETYQEGGSNSSTHGEETSDSKSDEFSNTVTYMTKEIETTTVGYQTTGNTNGYYRLVLAGTVHVFAVVGYDVASGEYFVYTYNILGDGSKGDAPTEYLDYSRKNSEFNDYETSVIPFEVPYFVNKYVNNRTAETDGLELDPKTGTITNYTPTGDEPDQIVVIPSYMSVPNNNGTNKSVKVTGIAPGLFKDNTDIIGVQLGAFIDEIPEAAFEGCSSLQYVTGPGVTKIGDNAFSGCTSLEEFNVPKEVIELGENAFEGVPEIKVTAANIDVAQAAAASGARNITLDISTIPSRESNGMELETGEIDSFEIWGGGKDYRGLSIKSDAASTVVNGISFTENTKIPMEFASESVTLDKVTVDCSGYALVLKAEETNVLLNEYANLMSNSGNVVISKNINLAKLSSRITGSLNVKGNMLVCGEVNDNGLLTFTDGEIIYLTEEEYENYLTSHYIYFDANSDDAYVGTASKLAAMNMPIGELPTPRRDFYTFEGWYTEPEDGDGEDDGAGDEITEDTLMTSLTDMTVYAHWIHNDVSEWVLASDMPEDAEVADQMWTYTLTSYTTSNSSTLSGWEKYDTTWEWGQWGTEIGPVRWDPGESESRKKRWVQGSEWIDTSYNLHEYHYYAWTTKYNYIYTTQSYAAKQGNGTPYKNEIWIDYTLPYLRKSKDGMDIYGPGPAGNYGTTSYFKADGTAGGLSPFERDRWISQGYTNYYDLWYYQDRSKVYTYYFRKFEDKEAYSYPDGENISNIREYVQYRTK